MSAVELGATEAHRRARRRSLKALLTLPSLKLSRSSGYGFIASSQQAGSLPPDILIEIAERLWPADILNFSLASSYTRTLLMPALYEAVILKSSRSCKITLKMLATRPDICGVIRKLAVRPNYYLAWPKANEPLDESWVAKAVERIAPNLQRLHTFDWDGLEMPDDQLWKTLQNSCPNLRTLYSNVGYRLLDPDSHLFDFKNLTSFTMTVRHGLNGSELFPTLEELPPRLVDMLTNHCPDLEELGICSFSSSARIFDIEPLTSASWPKLHSLTLGSFGYQEDFTLTPSNSYALGQFLSSHSSLTYLRLAWNFKRWLSPDTVPLWLSSSMNSVDDLNIGSKSSALPELSTFIGIYQQLAELPNPGSIETLDLTCEPIYDNRVAALCPILKKCTSMTSLDIWMHVPEDREGGADQNVFNGLLKDMLSSCAALEDFHFMCTTGFGIKCLQDLASQLYLLPELRTFSLTKGHKYLDEPMLDSALRIIRHNPSLPLQQINIRWAKEKCPNHLKQEGCYDITRDENGCIKTIIVFERGITVFGSTFSRRYRYRYKRKQRESINPSAKGKLQAVTTDAADEVDVVNDVDKDDDDGEVGGSSNGTWRRAFKARRLSRVLMGLS